MYNDARLDAVFGALADPSRRAMLGRLARGESSVTELAEPLDMSMPAVLKHLRVLESAGLVTSVKEGRVKRCQLDATPFDAVSSWLTETHAFWNAQLDRLAQHLSSSEESSKWPQPRHRRSIGSPSSARTRRRGRKSSKRGRTRKS